MSSYSVLYVFILLMLGSLGCSKDQRNPVGYNHSGNQMPIRADLDKIFPINTDRSIIRWKGTKRFFTAGHEGIVKVEEGFLLFKNDLLTGGKVVADMQTINITKTEESENDRISLTNYLKTKEFNSDKYPFAVFEILEVDTSDIGRNTVQVTGNLTVKDVTRKISIPAIIEQSAEGSWRFYTEFTLERSKWNIGVDGNLLERNLVDKHFGLNIELVTEEISLTR